jgi:hypothetical protein
MAIVIEIPPTPVFPEVPTPTVRPGQGGPIIVLFEIAVWLQLMTEVNDGTFQDPTWADWLAHPFEARRRIAVGVMCKECCGIVRREGDKTMRKIGPNLDKVSPKTTDDAKRARLRKRTRQPAW